MYNVAIITLSNRATQGVYEDKSGQYLKKKLKENDFNIVKYEIIPDDSIMLFELLNDAKDKADLIITTGGTGLTSNDETIDVVESMIDYEIRGMTIALHQHSLSKSSGAMFSRALCGVIDKTMIITMPGSLKAVEELSELFMHNLKHGLDHLNDVEIH